MVLVRYAGYSEIGTRTKIPKRKGTPSLSSRSRVKPQFCLRDRPGHTNRPDSRNIIAIR